MRWYKSKSEIAFQIVNTVFLLGIIFVCLFPIIHLLAISFSNPAEVITNRVTFIPRRPTLEAYRAVLKSETYNIATAYANTIYYTVLGTIINMVVVTAAAYPLSKKRLHGRKGLTFFFVFTTLFSGGLIPTYLVVRATGLTNTVWALVVPGALSVWHLFILRTYFQGIPGDLEEAASLDGLGNAGILLRIIIPVSIPIYAAFTVFFAVNHWNSYFNPMIYLDNRAQYPLQVMLRELFTANEMSDMNPMFQGAMGETKVIGDTIKAAAIVFVMAPILLIYPLVQKHFIKGMMLGSLKG